MRKITDAGWLLMATSTGIGWLIGDTTGAVVGFVLISTIFIFI